MKRVACEFEAEALASVWEGRWPLGAELSLREHVPHCAICSEVIALAQTFAQANQESHTIAAVPDSSRVWWTAQIRVRREANADAARPILATQIAACIWAAGLLAVCFGIALAWFHVTRDWLESLVPLLWTHGTPIAIAAAIVVILPTAAYFVLGKE